MVESFAFEDLAGIVLSIRRGPNPEPYPAPLSFPGRACIPQLSAAMLELFKKLPKSHARSESNPHLRDSLRNSFFSSGSALSDDVFSDDVPIAPARRGQERGRGQLHHSFDASILTEPVNALQSDLNPARKLTRDLPPLLSSPTAPSATKRHNTGPVIDFQEFAHSPERSPQRSPQPSPTRPKQFPHSLLTGDHTKIIQKEPSTSKLAGWFDGESSPINIGLLPSPTKEKVDPLSEIMLTTTKPTPTTPKPGLSSRFSFFTTRSTPPKLDLDQNDEFLNLDISTALFPAGAADPFSPASFKNLQQNAEGVLSRFQAAYKERTISLRDTTAEKETIAEELEGAATRSKHLKIQLDDLSARVVEQDKAMMELVDELANLKRARVEEEEARKRTIRPVVPSTSTPFNNAIQQEEAEAGPEDTNRRRSRRERLSSTSSTTDYESDNDSVFSKSRNTSPRMSLSSVSTISSPETYHQPDLSLTGISPTQIARRQNMGAGLLSTKDRRNQDENCVWSCANCQGGAASEAWGVVGMLKEENRCLKERVEHVEGALEGCLDVVGRLG